LVERVASYTEVTVSGAGLRIIGRGTGRRVQRKQPVDIWAPDSGGSLETYRQCERYIVMTGNPLGALGLADIDRHVDEVVAELDAGQARRAQNGAVVGHDDTTDVAGVNPHASPDHPEQTLSPMLASLLSIPDAGAGHSTGGYRSRNEALFAFVAGALRARVSTAAIISACLDDKYVGCAIHQHCRDNGGRAYVERQIRQARKKKSQPHADDLDTRPTYIESNGVLAFIKRDKAGATTIPICNFTARIEEDRTVDDGATLTREWVVSAILRDGRRLPRVTLTLAEMTGPWWVETFGADAIVKPDLARYLLPAIQTVSAPAPKRTIYAHLGWRKIDDRWLYLHAGGAIGADGPVGGYDVRPGGELAYYILPPVRDLKKAVQASLAMLELGAIGVELLGAVYRAPLNEFCEVTFSYFLAGATGTFKSAVTGVAQAHWGERWNYSRFPANWSSTPNSLEKLAFIAKDALFVVDDFAPKGHAYEIEKLHLTADRLLRAQANRGGRGRMNADGTLRQTYEPRGLVVASGEDIPKGHSLRARMIVGHIEKGAIDKAKLSLLQRNASDGLLAEAMAGYVRWIAAKATETFGAESSKWAIEQRDQRASHDHARTSDNSISLMLGIEQFLSFAEHVGAIDAVQRAEMSEQAWGEVGRAAQQQDEEQHGENPSEQFRDLTRAALMAGRGHLAVKATGDAPSGLEETCGWRRRDHHDQNGELHSYWDARGDRLGWIDGDDLYLIPAAAYACAERLSGEQKRSLGLTQRTLVF
jgi:hypothetical protein